MDAVIDQYKPRARHLSPVPARRAQPGRVEQAFVRTTPELLVPAGGRVVMVAPHPDDEVLALGATLAALGRLGHDICIVAVTDGEASHPRSSHFTPQALRDLRPRETHQALDRLDLQAEVLRLGLPDGDVSSHEKLLAGLIPVTADDTVFVPWRHDGHADHEACARAALAACRTVGARCIEFPVWALVPEHPAHARLRNRTLQRVSVAARLLDAKRHAIAAFGSQLTPDGVMPAVLEDAALDTWMGEHEWVMA